MINAIVFHSEQKAVNVLLFCLESEFDAQVEVVPTAGEVEKALPNNPKTNLVVIENGKDAEGLLQSLRAANSTISVILITLTGVGPSHNYAGIIGNVTIADLPQNLIELLRKHFGGPEKMAGAEDYCRIEATLLGRIGSLRGDIFIRLSDSKFIKLYKTGTTLQREDLQKVISSIKVRSLYIKKTDAAEFAEKFKEDLADMIAHARPDDPMFEQQVTDVHEMLHELAQKLGFSPAVRELAVQTVRLTLKKIGSSPRISKVLSNSQLRGKNYISNHSVLLSNLSCSIAAQIQMPSETTFQKLVLASLFHDFTFQDAHLAKISDRKSLEDCRAAIGEERYREVLAHPLRAAEIIRTLRELPGDVAFLVFQHHERPDGTGFPNGLQAHQIVALSAVFIVAHDILDELIHSEGEFRLEDFLKKYEYEYSSGTFKNIWRALAKNAA